MRAGIRSSKFHDHCCFAAQSHRQSASFCSLSNLWGTRSTNFIFGPAIACLPAPKSLPWQVAGAPGEPAGVQMRFPSKRTSRPPYSHRKNVSAAPNQPRSRSDEHRMASDASETISRRAVGKIASAPSLVIRLLVGARLPHETTMRARRAQADTQGKLAKKSYMALVAKQGQPWLVLL
jgi:hypothetical protein